MKWEVIVTAPTESLMAEVEAFVAQKPSWGTEGGKDGFVSAFGCATEDDANQMLDRIFVAFPQVTDWGARLVGAEVESDSE